MKIMKTFILIFLLLATNAEVSTNDNQKKNIDPLDEIVFKPEDPVKEEKEAFENAQKVLNKTQKDERKLFIPFGSHAVNPPLVSPPPPIFNSGILPIQPVYNLIHYPHQYSSPMVNYAYPTIFNPFYNHLLPYGMSNSHVNPHMLSSMGMYGLTPYNLSQMHNGNFGMLPYMNPHLSGMSGINNSAQNWDHEDVRKLQQNKYNGNFGMLPYMNPNLSGMSGINNSAQNWNNEDVKKMQQNPTNGNFGMLPYMNPNLSGMSGINNSAQNWDHEDVRKLQQNPSNGNFGMLPYMNPNLSGMSGINNSAQNWDHEDVRKLQQDESIRKGNITHI